MTNRAAIATPVVDVQGDRRWMCLHERYVGEAKEAEPEVVFIGDSIIQYLEHTEIWEKQFSQMHCLNFGVSADATQNVLWRLENGELDFTSKPKVIVLHVGTNNVSQGHEEEEVAGGIEACVQLIHKKVPDTTCIVLTLLPRGRDLNPLRSKISTINKRLLASLQDKPRVQVIQLDPGFVAADGTIEHHDMYDYLHLTKIGYQKAFSPVYDLLQDLL